MKRTKMFKALLGGGILLLGFALTGQALAQGGTWATKTPMPTARWGLSAGVVDGKLYAVGGVPAQFTCDFLATNEAYDPITNLWSIKASMPTARESLAVGVVNGILYAVGGGTGCGSISAALEAYNPITNLWSIKASMPTVRRLHAAGVVNGILYVVGGSDGTPSLLATVLAYNPVMDTWTPKAPLAAPRAGLAIGVVNGILYAVGGGGVGTVEAYNPVTDMWTTKASMPTLRDNFSVGVVNGILYVVGGNNSGILSLLATVEAYNPVTDTWTTNAPMPTARILPAAAAINGTLYVVGGENFTGTIFPTNEAFTPPFAAFAAKVVITLGLANANNDAFDLKATFTLGADNSIAPLTEDVHLQVGTFFTTIPAGSFTLDKKGRFKFDGVIGGVSLEAKITPLGPKSFEFKAQGQFADLTATVNPVTVGLTIGNDGGSIAVTADIFP